jgi:hypothetical protein
LLHHPTGKISGKIILKEDLLRFQEEGRQNREKQNPKNPAGFHDKDRPI